MSDRIDAAIETFAGGWCYTRSFTHPYVATRLTPQILQLHDGPRSNPNADVRRDEFVCFGCSPSEALEAAASAAKGSTSVAPCDQKNPATPSDRTHMEAYRPPSCAGVTEQLRFRDHSTPSSDWVAKRKSLQARLTPTTGSGDKPPESGAPAQGKCPSTQTARL